MIDRRSVLGLAAAAVAFSATGADAQDWKAKYPEIVFGKIPDENASGTMDRYQSLTQKAVALGEVA
mgnify:CR=1 FL=1